MTGYTHQLIEKKQTFPEFALSCARAFGALIMMRDDPMDAPIPERFEPSAYCKEKCEEAKALVERLSAMTPQEQYAFGYAAKDEEIRTVLELHQRSNGQISVMADMLAQVESWEPPTEEHIELKQFMLQQLQDTIKFESMGGYYEKRLQGLRDKNPHDFYQEELASARNDIEYHQRKYQEEVEGTEKRNQWLQELRASLSGK